jgi:sec-independent protein translocase protein TatC
MENKLLGSSGADMPVLDHLRELRTRLIVSLVVVACGACGTYLFSGLTFDLLTTPYFQYFPPGSLIGTGPAEAFLLKLKVAVFASVLVTSPILFHQCWLFVAPGLYEHERRLMLPFVVVSTLLFLGGSWICYSWIMPVSFGFFREQYASIGVTPQIRISEHLSLLIKAVIGFGIIFEAPVVAFFLARVGVLTHTMMIRWFKYAVVGIFVLAAVLTPTPDILTQTLFAVPLLGLYGLSVAVVRVAQRQPAEKSEQSAE